MSARRKSVKSPRSIGCRRLRFFCVLIVVFAVVAPFPIMQATSAAVGNLIKSITQSLSRYSTAQEDVASTQVPRRTHVPRISVVLGATRDVPIEAPMTSILIVSPEIASAVMNIRSLTLRGLSIGETILIAFDGQRRYTFLVEVVGKTYAATNTATERPAGEQDGFSGSYTMSYTAAFGAGPTMLRQNFEWRRKLSQGGTLRFSSDMFKFFGQGNQDGARATAPGFGMNRLTLGVDGPAGSLDILDSQINISPLSFNGYAMRGFHLVSTSASQLRGMEFFAGLARPSLSFFDQNQGSVMGLLLPVAQGQVWRVRVGLFVVSPGQNNKFRSGGSVAQIDARYEPTKNIQAEGELAYANGGLSWRARLDLRTGPIYAYGQILRFDRRSPLISIGAQGGGRETEAFAVQWQASTRLHASFNYDHGAIAPPANAGRAALDRTTLLANASYRIHQNSQLGFRYAQQQIETAAPVSGSRFRLETRTAAISHDIRFNQRWANNFEARVNSSRETSANAATEAGLSLSDQLRVSFKGGSASGFVNYTRQNASLAGLIVRNPELLPPVVQRAFAADPARFLQMNRDTLGLLLPGVELPQTRGLDAGVRLQAAISRINLATEIRYSANQIVAESQRNLLASINMSMRLDAANSVQLSSSRSFDLNNSGGQSALTVSYVHRFGTGSGGGMQFSKLLGLERGVIQGRVFIDLNGNGNDDADEPGLGGMKVQIDGDRSTTTDNRGHFRFQMNSGDYNVALISEELGLRWRASTLTEQRVSLSALRTMNVSFGLSDYGSVGGRVFNDLLQTGEKIAGSLPGVAGVRVTLSPINMAGPLRSSAGDGHGAYRFPQLPHGSYTLEVDRASLPADFDVPTLTSWVITVAPLENVYLDLPLSAQRAVSGIVFIDKNGDGKFDLEKDEPIEGARIIAGKTAVTSGRGGSYILRNIPFGKIEMRARAPWGAESDVIIIELSEGPVRRKGINLIVKR